MTKKRKSSRGIFGHVNHKTKLPKVEYPNLVEARKVAEKMKEETGMNFVPY